MAAKSRTALRGSGAGWCCHKRQQHGDLVSATRVDGHNSGVPRSGRGRAALGVGTNIPVARKGLLRNGPELGDGADCQVSTVPRLGRMFMARPTAGFGISRVLGRQAPQSAAANRHRVANHPAKRTRVAPRPNFAANPLSRGRVTGGCAHPRARRSFCAGLMLIPLSILTLASQLRQCVPVDAMWATLAVFGPLRR